MLVKRNDLRSSARAKFRFVNANELRLASGDFMASKNLPLLISSGAAIFAIALFGIYLQWNGLNCGVKVTDVAGLLAPLAVAATFIERAVEILVSPWRDGQANKLTKALNEVRARPADPLASAKNAVDLKAASEALDDYRSETQQIAFAVSLSLGMLTSISGVHALAPFTISAKCASGFASHHQEVFFLCLDVALSAALLAGGADGIHSVMNAITSFFSATADKAKQ